MTESDLEDLLSRPTPQDVEAARTLEGDVIILGVSGKMGPSLARLILRASKAAGVPRRVIGVARFTNAGERKRLADTGIHTIVCDLRDPAAPAALPKVANVIYMVGQKFGTTDRAADTWATNVLAASHAARQYRDSRIVAFSTGNVYPLTPVSSGGPDERHPVGPVGEYAQSALGRERVLEHHSTEHGTPMAILRLNYAVEPRYGVLRDVADRVRAKEAIDLSMGYVNVIWQRDACSVAWRAFAHCTSPPLVLNVTGPDIVSIRQLAMRFAERFGTEPRFEHTEVDTALLSDASRMVELLGPPETTLEEMVDRVAEWVEEGGRGLGAPTHYEVRDGSF